MVSFPPDNVVVVQLLQQRDFPDSCAWDALVFLFESDLLEGNNLAVLAVSGLVNYAICALANLVDLFILQSWGTDSRVSFVAIGPTQDVGLLRRETHPLHTVSASHVSEIWPAVSPKGLQHYSWSSWRLAFPVRPAVQRLEALWVRRVVGPRESLAFAELGKP